MVWVNYTERLRIDEANRTSVTTNSFQSAGYVQPGNLGEALHECIKGVVR